jgi:hypothetical protein
LFSTTYDVLKYGISLPVVICPRQTRTLKPFGLLDLKKRNINGCAMQADRVVASIGKTPVGMNRREARG